MVYLITYDLNKSGQNYDGLYEVLKSFGSWAHYLDSTWFIDTYSSIDVVRDKLLEAMDSNDILFVTKVTKSYTGWLVPEAWNWISSHVKD